LKNSKPVVFLRKPVVRAAEKGIRFGALRALFAVLSVPGSVFLTGLGISSAQVTTTAIENPPSYNTFPPPAPGGLYLDPVFGYAITRISNAAGTRNADGGGNLTYIVDEYSTMSPFNGDNSQLILVHQSYFGLYNGSGAYVKDLPLEINASSEPRWSRNDAVTLYYHSGNQLKSYNTSTGTSNVVHTFSEYSSISGMGESDISLDGDHFVLAGNSRYVFVYELSTNKKYPVFDTGGQSFDSIYITPNNNVIISWLQSGTSRKTGMELFDINMNFLRQVAHADGHKDVTVDTGGQEVLVWTNSNDAQPIPNCNNGIVKINLATAQQTCLLQLDWSLAVHISAPDNAGFAYIETYAPANPAPGTSAWVPYTNELVQVKLDGSQAVRLAHHRSRPWNSYNWQPKISTSRDGSRVVFNSNYDLQSISGYASEYSDVYIIAVGPAPVPTLSAPALTSATAVSQTEIDLSWSNPAGSIATGNAVLRCTGSGCTPSTSIASLSATATSYRDTSAAASTAYTYAIRASNATTTATSNLLTATTSGDSGPAAPILTSASAVSSAEVDLAWTNNATNASGVRVLQCPGISCTPSTLIATLAATSVGYKNTGLSSSAAYTYSIQAYNSSGSSNSNMMSATTQAGPQPPEAPVLSTASGRGFITLNWVENTSTIPVSSYDVLRCDGSGCTPSLVIASSVPSTTLSYTNSGLPRRTTFRYQIRANNSNGSTLSYVVSATTH